VIARWAATLRLAFRMVRRSPARSILVATLVAIPVLAGTFAAVAIRTGHLSPDEAVARQLGRADAVVLVTGHRSLDPASAVGQTGSGEWATVFGTSSPLPGSHAHSQFWHGWTADLPAGSRIIPAAWGRDQRITFGERSAGVVAIGLDLNDRVTEGIYSIESGAAPTTLDEVAVTMHLADRLHIDIGDTVTLPGNSAGTTKRVTAIVRNPQALSTDQVIGAIGGLGPLRSFDYGAGLWLIDTPAAAPDLHDALARVGAIYETRHQWTHPVPELAEDSNSVDVQVLLVLGTVTGFGLLEILLLAGAAFAVGARRQSHDLGLVAVCGGDEADVRRTVLAQGLALGIAGAAAGVVGGVAAVFFARPLIERFNDRALGALDVRVPDVVALVLLGVVAGLVAAVVPARAAARRSVLDMLRDRFPADGGRARNPRWATAAVVVGPLMVVGSALAWHRSTTGFRSTNVRLAGARDLLPAVSSAIRDNPWAAGIWIGSAIALAGLVRSCPTVIGLLGRLAGRLPLGPRLALRDASRHRHRTAPATAAVMTVLAGASVVVFVVSSTDARDRQFYRPGAPIGSISVSVQNGDSARLAGAVDRVRAAVGTATTVDIGEARGPGGGRQGAQLSAQVPICSSLGGGSGACGVTQVGVAGPGALRVLAGHPVPEVERALARGSAVVVAPVLSDSVVHVHNPSRHPAAGGGNQTLPAVALDAGVQGYVNLPEMLVSPATAAAHGWSVTPLTVLVTPERLPSTDAADRLSHELGNDFNLWVERGYDSRYSTVLLGLLGAAALATLAGTSIAVALAMAESRSDMATLAAVGASPARRRLHAMGQAATVGGLGAVIGIALGSMIAVATLGGSNLYPTSYPFRWLLALAVGAPLLSVAVAGAVTRSKVTLTRRLA
jgi:putative ABC transport system permease protein